MLTPKIDTSELLAVTDTADAFDLELAPGETYLYVATVASWIKQGDAPTATAAAPSMYVAAGREVLLTGGYAAGSKLSAIRATGNGNATLTQMRERPEFAGA